MPSGSSSFMLWSVIALPHPRISCGVTGITRLGPLAHGKFCEIQLFFEPVERLVADYTGVSQGKQALASSCKCFRAQRLGGEDGPTVALTRVGADPAFGF